MRDKIKYLINEYTEAINLLEEDRRNDGITISNAFRTAKIGAYQKVVDDLMMILDDEGR